MMSSPFGSPRADGRFGDDGPHEDAPAYPYDPVQAAATALTWVAGLGILLNCFTCGGIMSLASNRQVVRPAGMDDETWDAYRAGAESTPFLEVCFTGTATLMVYPIMLMGAMQMMQRRSYWLSNLSAVLAMLPCSLICVAGLPIGIWALVVLRDPRVRQTFR